MDIQSSVMLISGSILWVSAVFIEAYIQFDHLIPPCEAAMKFTGCNLIFVAFPMALILSAELHLMRKAGAMGLTCMLEIFCLLGLTGFEQLKGAHVPFCITAGICHTLVCFNMGFRDGLFSGAPLLFLSIVYCILHWRFKEKKYFDYLISLVVWGQHIWLALSRLILVWTIPSDWVDHYWFDIISSSLSAFMFFILFISAMSTANMPHDNWMRRLFYW
jgi:hypothetical protein